MRKLIPVLLLSFVNVVGFSILIPVLPVLLMRLTGESSGLLYGLLLSSYAFSQFLAAPILGSLSDRYGRRPLLLISQFGTFLSWIIFGAAFFVPFEAMVGNVHLSILVIALSRITDGLTGGNVSVAQAWVSDRTTAKEKTKAFGLVGAMFGLGFLIGPAIGGFSVSTSISFLGTAIFALILSLITLGFIYWGLPESLPVEKRNTKVSLSFLEHLNFSKKFDLFRHNSVIKNLLWVRVFFSLAFVGFTTSVILFLGRTYNLGPINLGLTMSAIGIFSVFNQAFLVPRISKRFGYFETFFGGLIIVSLALGVHSLLPFLFGNVFAGKLIVVFFLISFFLNLGISMVMTMFKTIIATNTEESKQGEAMGLDESISFFGQGVSPLFAGALYDAVGPIAFVFYGFALFVVTIRALRKCSVVARVEARR